MNGGRRRAVGAEEGRMRGTADEERRMMNQSGYEAAPRERGLWVLALGMRATGSSILQLILLIACCKI